MSELSLAQPQPAAAQPRKFLITGPDGKQYRVEGQDEEGALSALRKHLGDDTSGLSNEQQRALAMARARARRAAIDAAAQNGVDSLTPEQRKYYLEGIAIQRQAAAESMRQRATEGQGQTEQSSPTTFGQRTVDLIRSGASGLRTGIEGLAGMMGDARETQGDAAGWIAGKLGAGPEMQQRVNDVASRFSMLPFSPTSEQIHDLTSTVAGESYQPQTVAGEYARTIGEFAPAALIPAGNAGLGTRVLTQAVIPALGSETAGQIARGVGGGEKAERYARIVGALMSPLATTAARRAVTPLPVSAERKALVDTLQREGVPLTAGQATGRNALRYAESELGGGAAARFMEQQGDAFTSATLRRAGINAKRATPEVIDDAFRTIGKQFDDLAARNKLMPDRQLATDLTNTVGEYLTMTPESARAPIVRSVVDDIARASRGGLDGAAYQAVRSRLDKAARAARISDPQLSQALSGIRNSLDDAMERSISANNPGDANAWQEARRQYKSLLVVEKAATGAGENAAQGIISPSQLRNATVQQSRRDYARGRGDFADLARAGEGVMKPLPQSGTAPRLAARNLGTGITTLLGAGAGSAGGPIGSMVGAAAGAAVPYAAGRALFNEIVQAYLKNRVLSGQVADPKRTAIVSALLASQGQGRGQPALPAQ